MKKMRDIMVTLSFIYVLVLTIVYFGVTLYEGVSEVDSLSIEGYDLLFYQIMIAILLIRYPCKEKIKNIVMFLKNKATSSNDNNKQKQKQKTQKA